MAVRLEGKKVLVTGASGFIGSHLVESLVRKGCRVRALVHYNSRSECGNLKFIEPELRDEVEIFAGDVQDGYSVQSAITGCEVVFHLAALIAIPYSYVAPASYVATNVIGTVNVLQACRAEGVKRLIHTSTSECYGTARYTPIDEAHPLQAQSPYSATKIAADKLVESYFSSFHTPVVTVRPFNTFGPRQSARAVIPTILTQLIAGQNFIRLGSLSPVRDLVFVEDTVRGFIALAECDAAVGRTVNVGTGKGISIGDLANLAMRVVGRTVEIHCEKERVRPEGSEVLNLICDARLVEQFTQWRPAISLEEGLRRTADFVAANLPIYHIGEYVL